MIQVKSWDSFAKVWTMCITECFKQWIITGLTV
jgi:hypothetical protein